MATVQNFINSALRLIRVLDSGESPTATESNDALVALNQILSLWSAERIMIYGIRKETFPLTGAVSYTMGPGGVFATARPTSVVAVRAHSGTTGRGLRLVDVNRWASLMERGGAINLPMKANIVYGFPLATVSLWPVPLAGVTVDLYVTHEFSTFPAFETPDAPAGPMHSFVPQQLTYTLAANTATFTIGPGGQLASTRPARCQSIAVTSGGYRRSVEIVSSAEWATLIEPIGSSITLPLECYVDYAFPLATVNVWPVPGAGTSLEIHSLQQFTAFASLGDTIDLPPGYEEALRFALAGVLAPEYGSAMPPEYAAAAAESKQALAAMNASTIAQIAQPTTPPATPPATAVTTAS